MFELITCYWNCNLRCVVAALVNGSTVFIALYTAGIMVSADDAISGNIVTFRSANLKIICYRIISRGSGGTKSGSCINDTISIENVITAACGNRRNETRILNF